MTTNQPTTPVTEVKPGQRVRFTGGHTATVESVRREAGYTYLYRTGDTKPYALPDSAVVYVLDAGTTQAVRDAMHELDKIKAPTKRAQFVAAAIISFKHQHEVETFTRWWRIRAGVQDVALLPRTTWTVHESADLPGAAPLGTHSTAELLITLSQAEGAVIIDWPSVTFHWGVMVTFTWANTHYVARSADYQLTETYLSS